MLGWRAMKNALKVENVVAEPNAVEYGFLEAGELQDGSVVRIPVALINGKYDGPVLYLQAASDGNELNGIAVIHHILNTVATDCLRGAIIAVPIVNPLAFYFNQAYSIADRRKMNRCFPGKKHGTSSERIAYKLFHEAVLQAQYCIDLHQGGVHPMLDSVNIRTDSHHHLHRKCRELARVFGIEFILDQLGPEGQLAQAAPDQGIATIDPELGGCHGWDKNSIEKGIRGVENVLKYYGFVDGTPEIPPSQTIVRRFAEIRNDHGGFIRYRAALGELVEYRQPVADICDAFGRVKETILAPRKGVLWSTSLYPMVTGGSTIGTLGVQVSHIRNHP